MSVHHNWYFLAPSPRYLWTLPNTLFSYSNLYFVISPPSLPSHVCLFDSFTCIQFSVVLRFIQFCKRLNQNMASGIRNRINIFELITCIFVLKVDMPILTCIFFTFNLIDLDLWNAFCEVSPWGSFLFTLQRQKKVCTPGDEADMKIHKKLFSGIPINFTFFVISPKLKEFKAKILDL